MTDTSDGKSQPIETETSSDDSNKTKQTAPMDGGSLSQIPANVNIHQFYPDIKFTGSKDVAPSPDGSDWGQRVKKPEKSENEEQEEVFSTQVDEETLEQARKRQGLMELAKDFLPALPCITMQEVISEKANQHLQEALAHMSNSTYETAIRCLTKAINLQPQEVELYVHRAEAYLRLTDLSSAILNYKHACVLDPNKVQYYNRLAFVYYFHGQCLFDQKLFPEALEAFSRATEMRPDVIGYHTRSIACLAALQRHGECLALVNKRLETEQENADLYIMRARLHRLFRNMTLCYYDVKDALGLEPGHPEALALMVSLEHKSSELKIQAMQLSLLGRHRDALQKISIAIETNPAQAEFHVQRGALHRHLGDFNAAIDDYLLALDKTDHNEESPLYVDTQRQLLLTYNDFAVECFTKNYFEEAIILLNKAIKGEKGEKGLYINRGDCFFKEGNLQFAMADYQQSLELDGTDAAVHSRIAVIHNEYGVKEFQDKSYMEAESHFSLAIQHNPRIGQYYVSRCRVRQLMENLSGARQDILMALHLQPGHPEVTSLMGRLYPGKSVQDVIHSPAAQPARQATSNLVITASPVKLDPIQSQSEGDVRAESPAGVDDRAPPIAGSPWLPGHSFPPLKACMDERDFNIKIAVEKKYINTQVKDALHNRRSLKHKGGRIQPLPSEMPQGVRTKKGVLVPLPPKSEKTRGWRQYGSGIGVGSGGE